MKKLLFLVFILGAFLQMHAQSSCATNEVHARAVQKNPSILEYTEFLENYIREYIRENPIDRGSRAVITIPTVFHVVYKTADENIPDARIYEQIARLNKDFAALNDEVLGTNLNNVPSEFRNLIANIEVQFCLAQRTPTGTATNGINRKLTTVTSWGTSTNLKNSSKGGVTIWDRSKYLNIWVCNIGNGSTGYAQLPANTTSSTDGVVLDYRVVGVNSNTIWPGYNLGRVGTHEVAHWLGLDEIWGNTTCGTDNVSDTPVHNALNTGCPVYPHLSTCTGTPVEMTMNFMDLTNDACRYMFTLGQKARIRALLDGTTGSRSTLKNSLGCLPPSATCNAPTGLAASNITTSSTTISWTAVSGSSGYFLEWKPNSATVWNEVPLSGSTSNTYTLTGLTASTTYNFRVRTSCSSALSLYSSVINVVTLGNSVCSQPIGLTTTNITSSGATVSWNAVSGALGYTFEYSVLNSNSWTILNVTSPSASLSGLTPSTSYSTRVRTRCTSTLFSSYTTGAFGTTASGPVCPDNYEPNNSSSAAKAITPGTTISASIETSLDTDYFKFGTSSSTPKNIKVTLSNIPAGKDYDLILYQIVSNKLTERRRSDLDGNVNEVVIYNTTSTGNYVVYVLPYLGSSDAANCYNLLVQLSSTAFALPSSTASRAEVPVQEHDILIMPNPASESVRILLPFSENEREGVLTVSDLSGKIMYMSPIIAESEIHQSEFNVSHFSPGIYLVHFTTESKRTTSKLLITK
jgi:hypothetical protein